MFKIAALISLLITFALGSPTPDARIIGGRDAVRRQAPFSVSVRNTGTNFHVGGGALISDRWVVTCASVLQGRADTSFDVALGIVQLSQSSVSGSVTRRSAEIVPHPGFVLSSMINDIGLIRLGGVSSVSFSTFIMPIFFEATRWDTPATSVGSQFSKREPNLHNVGQTLNNFSTPINVNLKDAPDALTSFINSDRPIFHEINEHNNQELQVEEQQQQQPEFAYTVKILNEKEENLLIQGCDNKSDVIEFLSFSSRDHQNLSSAVLLINIQCKGEHLELNIDEQNKLSELLTVKDVVVVIYGKNSSKSSIYWTSKKIGHLLALKSFGEILHNDLKIMEAFIQKFLMNSLGSGQTGIISTFTITSETHQIDINLLADRRDYNLQLIAAEQGNMQVVRILLKLGMITDLLHIDAQTLAWSKNHHGVLLELLKANLPYPSSFDVKKCSAELKEFYINSRNLHKAIKVNDQDGVKAILSQNLDLKHYYNSSNESALKIAIEAKSLDIYDVLLDHKLKFAPHEDAEDFYKDMKYEMKRKLREIHNKYSQVSDEKHLSILMANSFVSHDNENATQNLEHIQRAFRTLNANIFIRIILMIVAASKKFKIIFDFNRDSVNVADPTVESNTQGLFYLSGRIYIGAKQLLNKATENETFGVIAHELCHYAMNIVYGNEANPYAVKDQQTLQEFEDVSTESQRNFEKEKIVDLVYECYPQEMHHAELIVRVVHMLAFYWNQPDKIQEMRNYFSGLFNFYETKVVPEMKAALPQIEKKVELEIKKKDKKISKLRFYLFISIGLGIVLACLSSWYFYVPTYKFSKLSENNQEKVKNALVKYKNVEIKFVELFPGNSDIFNNLTSDHISLILDNKALDFDDAQFHYLELQIDLKWENLAEKLKEKFLGSNLNFQGKIVKFKVLFESFPVAFNALTSQQIIDVLSGNELKIGEKFESKVKFFVERKFIPEDAILINFEYTLGYDYVDNYQTHDIHVKKRTKNKSFQEFSDEFLKKDFNEISQIFDKIQQNSFFKILNYDLNHKVFIFLHKTSSDIVEQAQKEKILILSSEAGAGKTVTFEKLAMETKSKFPTFWVSYIDLPKYTHLYKSGTTAEDLLKQILRLDYAKNEFEAKIFEESFKSIISKLLRTKFKNFFIRFLDTNYPKVFDFLFEFFKPDHDLLVDLLHVHEPETFFTAIFNPNHFALFTNPEDIKNLAQNCLTDAELQKFLTGKNQKGKILFGIHFYGLLGVTKVHDDFKVEIEELEGASFWEFFPMVKDRLKVEEQKELFVAALSPKIYLYYDKMFSTADFSEYEKLWTNFENLLTKTEMQNSLGDALLLYFELNPIWFSGHEKFLNLLIKKAKKFLSNLQIFEMFNSKNILHEAHWDAPSFRILWNFLNNHTNEEERRKILLQDDFDDKNFYFWNSRNELKKSYSSYKYYYYYFDFTPFKIFHRAFILPNYAFDFTKEIYEKYFNKSEIQEIILNSNDFLYYVIFYEDEDPFRKFSSFLEKVFEGNEKKLKEFLERKIEPTNLSIFELVEDFRGNRNSEPDWFDNFKILTELHVKIKNH